MSEAEAPGSANWVGYAGLTELPALAPGKSSYPAYVGSDPNRIFSLYYAPLWVRTENLAGVQQVVTAPWSYEHRPYAYVVHGHDNFRQFIWHWDMGLHPKIWLRLQARYEHAGGQDVFVAPETYAEFLALDQQDRTAFLFDQTLTQLNTIFIGGWRETGSDGKQHPKGSVELWSDKTVVRGVYFGKDYLDLSKHCVTVGGRHCLKFRAPGPTDVYVPCFTLDELEGQEV